MADMRVFRTATHGVLTASSTGTLLTTGAGTETLGTYVELISSTTINACGIEVTLFTPSLVDTYLVSIAIGTAGSEQVLFKVGAGQGRANSAGYSAYFPIRIPAGTRISAAAQDATGGGTNTIRVAVRLHSASDFNAGYQVVTYGGSTSDGTTVDPGGTINTVGSWVQMTAATTAFHNGLLIYYNANVNTAMTAATWLLNVAIGAGGSEQTIISGIGIGAEVTYDGYTQIYSPLIPISIPIGTRIALQCQCTTNDATDRLLRCIVYGVG